MRTIQDVLVDHFVDRWKCACGGLAFDWESGDLGDWPRQWADHVFDILAADLGLKPDTTPHSRFVEGGKVVSHQERIVSAWYETHRTKAK